MPARIPVSRTLPRLASGAAVLALGLAGLTACGGDNGSGASDSTSAASSTGESSSASSAASSSGASAEAQAITATEENFSISLDEDNLMVEYRVGARIPESAQLYALPQEVAVEVPAIRAYKYMVVNNRVVLIDPATSEVVAEVVD